MLIFYQLVDDNLSENIAKAFYESGTAVGVNLDDVFLCMCADFHTHLSVLPATFWIKSCVSFILGGEHK